MYSWILAITPSNTVRVVPASRYPNALVCASNVASSAVAVGSVVVPSKDSLMRNALWQEPQTRVAPGQVVACYDGNVLLGGGIAAA